MLKECSRWSGKSTFLVFAAILQINLTHPYAAVFWDESLNGDLSNSRSSPSPFTLENGVNSLSGSLDGTTDPQDWITLTVPVGFQLSSLTLVSYTSTDAQGFTGVQSGSVFVGNPQTASPYLGYAHFGKGAQNGSLPTANLIGVDILPIMGNTSAAPGSQGFTPPLAAGDYAFLIQQTGASTSYQFDYGVTAVPEPSSQAAIAILCAAAYLLKRRLSRNSQRT